MHNQAAANLKALIESTGDLIWSVDLEGRLIAFNTALETYIRLSFHAELKKGMRFHELFPPDRTAIFHGYYQQALHEGAFQVEYTQLAGTTLEMSLNSIVSDGTVTGVSVFAHDITVRKLNEEALRHLAAAVESSHDAIITHSPNGEILTWNRASERMFGYRPGEAIGRPITLIVPPERLAEVKAYNAEILSGHTMRETDGVGLHREGQRIPLSLSSWPVRNAAGKITAISDSIRDVTGKLEAERIKGMLAAIVESSDDAIHGVSLDGIILSWNPGAERMCGYAREEVVGKHLEFLVCQSREWIENNHVQLAAGKPLPAFDTVFRHKDGRLIDVSVCASPVRDASGTVVSVAGIARDIGPRKKLERALIEAEKKYRIIFDGALEGMFQTVLDGPILTANAAAARMLGYDSPEELLTSVKDVRRTIWADLAVRATYVKRVGGPEFKAVLGFECQFRRKDGSLIWVSLNGRLVRDEQGAPLYHEGFIEDITARKMATEAMAESETRFRKLFEESSTVLLLIEPEGGEIVDANRAAEIYYGYSRTQLVGANICLLNPLTHEQIKAERACALREEQKYFNFQHRLASGEMRDIRVYSSPITIDRRILLYSLIFDVTEQKKTEQLLRETAANLAASQQIGGLGNYDLNTTTGVWTSSKVMDEIFGITQEYEHTVEGWANLIHPDDRAMMTEHLFHEVLENRQPFDKEYRIIRHLDRAERWVHGLGKVEYSADGRPLRMHGVIKDITEHKHAEIAMRSSEQRYRTVFQASLDCIAITRQRDGAIIDVNQSYLEMLGFDLGEVMGHNCVELNLWAEPDARERMDEVLLQNGSFRDARTRYRKKNGDLLWVLISSSSIEIEGEPCVLTIIRDVSDAKAAEDKIWNLAFYDPLTRLPNRRLLMDRLRQLLNLGKRTTRMRALLFIDLDNFKTLNDTLGHQNGDQLLREMARRLVSCVRESDTVARLGGDEFVVLLDGLDYHPEHAAQQMEAIAYKILASVEQPFWLDNREYFSTSSIGITVFSGNHFTADELLQQADIAMYQAKSAGRNTLRFFEPALQTAVQERAALSDQMRIGLRRSEFIIYLQPQVDSNGMIGAEALVRWQHPRRGLLYPGDFIPLAEETGLILQLGAQVLEAACLKIAEWNHCSPSTPVRISVNISARQFYLPTFVAQILAVLKRTGADPSLLNLEITETILLDNIEEAIEKMRELKEHGLRFSLDDFGTGYSSLSYLKRLPFDQLKIDRSFVHDLLDDIGSRAIAQTVISLGQALDLEVMAEGVETEAQRVQLEELGCHKFQGYLFARPIPLEEFERNWLAAGQPIGD